jgi:23S rRNA pseudouridine2457 synthase
MQKNTVVYPRDRPKLRESSSSRLILLHKPYHVMCQFSPEGERLTLSEIMVANADDRPRDVYPAGRLDYDSEGLVLLTNDGVWQARIAQPKSKMLKTYLAQVEGTINAQQVSALGDGIMLNDGRAQAFHVERVDPPPEVSERHPPVRYRASIPTDWLRLSLNEGRNRQVRRMTATVGLPTLRLIREGIGPWTLEGLAVGEWREIDVAEASRVLGPAQR